VRKNALMVLSHLILNGMVKVKGQIFEMAKCIEDPDIRIADLAKLFFSELAGKDNAVYNNLPDIISGLSNPTTGVNQQTFNTIVKFLFSFISKEKQTENLVEKLCQRFKGTDDVRQWKDISYCLSLLNCSAEKRFGSLSLPPKEKTQTCTNKSFKLTFSFIASASWQRIFHCIKLPWETRRFTSTLVR